MSNSTVIRYIRAIIPSLHSYTNLTWCYILSLYRPNSNSLSKIVYKPSFIGSSSKFLLPTLEAVGADIISVSSSAQTTIVKRRKNEYGDFQLTAEIA